jgi:hypothetical protein
MYHGTMSITGSLQPAHRENYAVKIAGVTFLEATMCSDFCLLGDPLLASQEAGRGMNHISM